MIRIEKLRKGLFSKDIESSGSGCFMFWIEVFETVLNVVERTKDNFDSLSVKTRSRCEAFIQGWQMKFQKDRLLNHDFSIEKFIPCGILNQSCLPAMDIYAHLGPS